MLIAAGANDGLHEREEEREKVHIRESWILDGKTRFQVLSRARSRGAVETRRRTPKHRPQKAETVVLACGQPSLLTNTDDLYPK